MRRGLLWLAGLVALAGCASVPDHGPVTAGGRAESTIEAQPFDYNPPGPRDDALPDDIVAGFLSAQQAVPVSTRVAEEYLTTDGAEGWRPDRKTIVYTSQRVVATGTRVSVRLRGASLLDASGRWQGPWSGDGEGELTLRVDREERQWRIVNPPPALIIPRSHFESRYQAFSLYFFDPTGSVLVPEPVYLPVGVQAATRLVDGLLQGPPSEGREVERSYLPAGTDLGVGVPIKAGVAEIPLSAEVADLRPVDLDHALAQLAFTLRQLPEVKGLRLLVDGAPLGLPGSDVLPVTTGQEYAPTVDWASPDLFGLRGRQVVRVTNGAASTVAVLPRRLLEVSGAPRSLGVTVAGDRTAVVSGDGTRVWMTTSREGTAVPPTTVARGTDLLRPMWDRTGRLWLIDRTTTGSAIRVVSDGGRTTLRSPDVDRLRVEAAALSRDGTRLVMVMQRPGGGSVVRLFRVVRDPLGEPLRLSHGTTLPAPNPWRDPQAIGWWGPTSIAVMTRPSAFSTRVQQLATDGASVAVTGSVRIDLLFEAAQTMAVSPADPKSLVVVDDTGDVHELGADGRWTDVELPTRMRAPAYVG